MKIRLKSLDIKSWLARTWPKLMISGLKMCLEFWSLQRSRKSSTRFKSSNRQLGQKLFFGDGAQIFMAS